MNFVVQSVCIKTNHMRRLFVFLFILFTVTGTSAFAAEGNPVLNVYYQIKDALLAGNASLASAKSTALSNLVQENKQLNLKSESVALLLKQAQKLAAVKELKAQRDAFSSLSSTLIELAKTEKLSHEPVYKVYCPMKNAWWLSNDKSV